MKINNFFSGRDHTLPVLYFNFLIKFMIYRGLR
nr:MAG TPA: hypothetical protein [Caudoviricetes sp.]